MKDLSSLGDLDAPILQWLIFTNTIYYKFDWSSTDAEVFSLFHPNHSHFRFDPDSSSLMTYFCDLCGNFVTNYSIQCSECGYDVCSSCLRLVSIGIPKLFINESNIHFFANSFGKYLKLLNRSSISDRDSVLKYLLNISCFISLDHLKSDIASLAALSAQEITQISSFCLKQSYFPVNEALALHITCSRLGKKMANTDLVLAGSSLLDVSSNIIENMPSRELSAMLLLQKPNQNFRSRNVIDLISSFEIKKICDSSKVSLTLDLMFKSKMLKPHSGEKKGFSKAIQSLFSSTYFSAFDISKFNHHLFFAPMMEASVRLWCTLLCIALIFSLALFPDDDFFAFTVLGFVGGSSLLEEFYEFMNNPGEHFQSFWNIVDFGISASSICALALRISYFSFNGTDVMYFLYKFFIVISGICFSFRLLSFFRLSNTMGPLVIIFVKMFNDLFRFLFLSFVLLVAYAIGMTALLSDYSAEIGTGYFDSFGNSFLTLVYSLLGNYSTDSFSNLESSIVYSIVNALFIAFLITHVIMLINFLIAMMSTTFTVIYEDSHTEFKFLKLEMIRESYTSRLRLPPPFTIISECVDLFISAVSSVWKLLCFASKKGRRNINTGWYCKHCLAFNGLEKFTVREAAVSILQSESLVENPHLAHQISLLFSDDQLACRNCYNPCSKGKFRERVQSNLSRMLWGLSILPVMLIFVIFDFILGTFSMLMKKIKSPSKKRPDFLSSMPTVVGTSTIEIFSSGEDFSSDKETHLLDDADEKKLQSEEKRRDSVIPAFEEKNLSTFGNFTHRLNKTFQEIMDSWDSQKSDFNNQRLLSMFIHSSLPDPLHQ